MTTCGKRWRRYEISAIATAYPRPLSPALGYPDKPIVMVGIKRQPKEIILTALLRTGQQRPFFTSSPPLPSAMVRPDHTVRVIYC